MRERADAARNRRRVLEAARELFRRPGPVTMDDIAREAGVGRATLYRRYPDTASIAVALLDRHERDLQERLLRGDPPLGPGAAPAERLAAFYEAMVELLDAHGDLALRCETGPARFTTGAYGVWRAHVRALVRATGRDDPEALVDVLLAPLAPEVHRYQRTDLGLGTRDIGGGLALLAHRVLG